MAIGRKRHPPEGNDMTEDERIAIEAAAWRTLVGHLQKRTDVQNIDLMNLAGFCRNCMSRWMANAAGERGVDLDEAGAREIVYGMPYPEWKARHQQEATPEQLERFKRLRPEDTTD
jgi:uncharacterized protein